jgi:hypothetical protein
MLYLDLAFPVFLAVSAVVIGANLVNPSIHVPTLVWHNVCTLCHEFGGLAVPDFPAYASTLT